MKTTLNTLILVAMASALFTGCFKDHRIEGNYNMATENRATQPFTRINSEGNFEIYVSYSNQPSISVECESNLLPYVSTSSGGTTLTISNVRAYNLRNHYPIKVYVSTPDIRAIRLSGSGNIFCDSINTSVAEFELSGSGNIQSGVWANEVNAKISGSGNIKLDGSCDISSIKISGSGDVQASNLLQDKCDVNISGSGSTYVNVINSLDVKISGSGKTYYKGNPVIHSNINGSGHIININ